MTDQADMEARAMLAAEFGHGNVGTSLAVGGMKNHAKVISAMLAFEDKRAAEREAAAYARAAEVAQSEADDILSYAQTDWQLGRASMATTISLAILALGEAKG